MNGPGGEWVQLTEWEPCGKGQLCWVAPPWEDPEQALENLKAMMDKRIEDQRQRREEYLKGKRKGDHSDGGAVDG